MRIYLGKDRQNATQTMTVTNASVRSLTRRVERVGHKLYMDNFFSPLDIYGDLHTRDINSYGTIRQNCKRFPRGLDNKTLKLKQVDICARVRGNLTAVICTDK
jgi:hypothetical protein